jgi:hypothetical protein
MGPQVAAMPVRTETVAIRGQARTTHYKWPAAAYRNGLVEIE